MLAHLFIDAAQFDIIYMVWKFQQKNTKNNHKIDFYKTFLPFFDSLPSVRSLACDWLLSGRREKALIVVCVGM
jgi:hypothetical protein